MAIEEENSEYTEQEYLFWLSQISGIGAVTIRKLQTKFGSYQDVYRAAAANNIEEKALTERLHLRNGQWHAVCEAVGQLKNVRTTLEEMKRRNISFVPYFSKEYPQRLLEISDFPVGLYVRGKLPEENRPVVAIVGARNCSAYGQQLAETFARMLSAEGVQIISGLALGIDGAAHLGALKANTATFGILGCGGAMCC